MPVSDAPPSPVEGMSVALVLATSTGGVGRHVHSLAAGLLAGKARVAVLGPAGTDALFGFSALGATFVPVEISAGPRPVADSRAAWRLRRPLRDADLVHAHGLRAGFVAGIALGPPRRGRPPYAVTWHNALLPGPGRAGLATRHLGAAVQRAVARLADLTVGASPDLVDRARELGARDACFVPVAAPPLPPPGRDPAEVRAELGADTRPLVLAVGRLGAQKDYPTLLGAAAGWAEREPVPVVAIVGEGPCRGELEERVRRERLPVRLLGHRADIADLLQACDVVVLSSVWEARALAAQEALRVGRPLVATAVGGIPELVGDAAMLVPPRDPAAMQSAVARVLDDGTLAARLASAGAARAGDLPTEEDMVAALAGHYQRLVASRTR